MARLPQELIDAVVMEVKGKSDLQACSLAARNFVPTSQSSLFRRMYLEWDPSSRTAPAFERARSFLQDHPHLALYVRDLTTLNIPKSHQDQAILEIVFRMLRNLERLAINGHAQNWDDLLTHLTYTISCTISLPSLQRLHLLRILRLPASVVLHAASCVRVLSLDRITPQSLRDIPAHIPPNTQLENLILPWCLTTNALIRACDFLLTPQNLRRLSIESHQRHTFSIYSSNAEYLRYLSIFHYSRIYVLWLPRLVGTEGLWTLPENLSSTIVTLPAVSPRLEALHITIRISTFQTAPTWQDHIPVPLFAARSYRDQLPALRDIQCCFGYFDTFMPCSGIWFEFALQSFIELIESQMPAPFHDGILTVGRASHRSRVNYLDTTWTICHDFQEPRGIMKTATSAALK
ncbi:hypothetical protein B0H14DRAFT_2638609 [Mycena olivaceomarginata]|nr:hypothetical protein B0H14DRAFT_2638609 [Mycena olivaceomarginata]